MAISNNIPTNKSLYAKVKSEAKRKFKVWPSAYASSWLVQEYKRRGGKYSSKRSEKSKKSKRGSSKRSKRSNKRPSYKRGSSKSSKRSSSKRGSSKKSKRGSSSSGLRRWYNEQWIDICKLPKIVKCGRKSAKSGKYPVCRPLKRVTNKSPKSIKQIDKSKIKKLCSKKRSNPRKKIYF